MAVTQLVLTGVPAFVGVVRGPTSVGFFVDDKQFDPNRLIEVDLAKNPARVDPARWATDVDCDSQTTGGLTTIGPEFPKDNRYVGGVYLAERLVKKYASVLAGWPESPDDIYQFQAVLREEKGTVTRYHGFKVQVLSAGRGTQAHVAFIQPGDSTPGPRSTRQWIDLADPGTCDPKSNGFTTIDAASPPGTIGALFLNAEVFAKDPPSWPKFPRWLGW